DMDQEILPFQANLAYQVPRHKEADYIGKTKLEKVRAQLDAGDYPFTHQLVGMVLGGAEIDDYAPDFWLISDSCDAEPIAYINSPAYLPELNDNIAMRYVPVESTGLGTELWVHLIDAYADVPCNLEAAEMVEIPFRQSANPNQRDRLRAKGRAAA